MAFSSSVSRMGFLGRAALLSALPIACTQVQGSLDDPALIGSAQAALTVVPADVQCMVVNVTGMATVQRKFDVTPGSSAHLRINQLPIGGAMVVASGYPRTCALTGAGEVPSWFTDAKLVTILPGDATTFEMSLQPNVNRAGEGIATVWFNFGGDGGTDGGQEACVPDCNGKACGPDGCGGTCGTCPGNYYCNGNTCQCLPNCGGRACGPDGCGGTCGTCPPGTGCNGTYCQCTPSCAGRECGSNGCGGTCGQCSEDQVCRAGHCVSSCTCPRCKPGWICDPSSCACEPGW
jgi:hypothetical protein